MTGNFQHRDFGYNRNTKEDGLIGRAYESNGAAMYEVAVPQHGDSWAGGYHISDWAEDVLQLSNNERLKSSSLTGAICLYLCSSTAAQ